MCKNIRQKCETPLSPKLSFIPILFLPPAAHAKAEPNAPPHAMKKCCRKKIVKKKYCKNSHSHHHT